MTGDARAPLRRSPIHELHAELGARFTDFGGWEMPVRYAGTIAEHLAVRERVGIFDVSHLGRFRFSGPGATDTLRRLFCNDAAAIAPGRAQYTMALNERGGVEDDIIIWRWDEDDWWVLPNAANQDKVMGFVEAAAPAGTTIVPLRDDTAFFAIQGPEAPERMRTILGDAPRRFRLLRATFDDVEILGAGTGYTGEAGGEIAVPAAIAADVFRAFVDAGAEPCGLGARDTLRLEMGYPLWGQDLDPDTTPLEADLAWVVDWDHEFVGRDALERQRREGLPRKRVGLVMGVDGGDPRVARQVPRHGYPIRTDRSEGHITSGNFSPVLGRGIGMGFLAPPDDDATVVEVAIRDRWVPATRQDPPFIDRR